MTALTNAEKQKAHRQRQRERMARYEGALREIYGLAANPDINEMEAVLSIEDIARQALGDVG